ncbi:MAG: helix-turn-helix transcriptional regulator [Treponema sp.]|nr:helix-turn-helix transcriptional regulator [Treponema sp.]
MIENGRCFPSLQMLRQIASALKVDSLDLFDKDGFEFQNLEILRKNMIENIVNCVNKTFDEIK